MNHKESLAAQSAAHQAQGISMLDLIIVLAKYKKLLIGLPLAAALVAAAVSMMLPSVYKASTKMLPPQQAQSGASALLAQLGGAAGLAASVAGMKNPGDMYVGMLKSRTVADKLITRFELKKAYDTDSQEIARMTLEGNTQISAGKDGMITVEVEDKSRLLVAKLANTYVDELQRLSGGLAVTEASQRRLFFERQLETAKDKLANVEMSLKGALDKGGVFSVDAESRAVLETAARLKAQISAKEIQLGAMRPFVTSQHPEFRRIEEELVSLRAELSRLQGAQAATGSGQVTQAKPSGLDKVQLMRDLKYYQMLYELLAKQYELARLDEAKEPSLVQVLDPAVDPERRSGPKRVLIVLASMVLAALAAVTLAFFLDARQRIMKDPVDAVRWNELKKHLRFK
jgi:tyrosine-protein kinase Etk/Wzc